MKKHVISATDGAYQAKDRELTLPGTTRRQVGFASDIAPGDDDFWYDDAIDFVDLTEAESNLSKSGNRPGAKAVKGPDTSKAMRMAKLDLACSQPASQKKSPNSISPRKKVKRSSSKRNRSSSDYGDSDLGLDNLLSPLVSQSQMDHQGDDDFYDETGFPVEMSSVNDSIDDLPPLEDLPDLSRKDDPPVEVGKTAASEEGRNMTSPTQILSSSWSFGNPGVLSVSARSIENITSPYIPEHHAKRQACPLRELSDPCENSRKRTRIEKHDIEQHGTDNATAASVSVQEASNEEGRVSQMEGNDQSLFEEFGDFVNFF